VAWRGCGEFESLCHEMEGEEDMMLFGERIDVGDAGRGCGD
jgi:hypothetical protein